MSTIQLITSQSVSKLLKEYEFTGKEIDVTGCVIEKYKRNGKEYKLRVEQSNGINHGKGTMKSEDGIIIAELIFEDGKLTGNCTIKNEDGVVQFKGYMVNGEKCGECHEYDEKGRPIFWGEYKDGKQVRYFEESKEKTGFYIQRSRKELKIVSYTQYNAATEKREGTCYLVDTSGKVKREVIMNNNKEVQTVREFEGDKMKEYDSNKELKYEGGFTGDWKGGYQYHGSGILYENGSELYNGGFYNGKYHGNGVLYENGVELYKGGFNNGKYHGNGVLYKNGSEYYEGGFTNGEFTMKYEEIPNGFFRGYFKGSIANSKEVIVTQMNPGTRMKHGRCLVFRTDAPKELNPEKNRPDYEKHYENNKFVYNRVCVEGDQIVKYEHDESRETTYEVYRGEFKYSDGKFLRWGTGMEYIKCEIGWLRDLIGGKELSYDGEFANDCYHGNGTLYRNQHVSFTGEWKCGYPEGQGCLYDENDKIKKEGIWHLGNCDGVDYDEESSRGFCGPRLHPRKSETKERMKKIRVEDRYWNESVLACSGLKLYLLRGIKEFVVAENTMNKQPSNQNNQSNQNNDSMVGMRLDLSEFKHLKRVEIGSRCFKHVREFVIDGLSKLESVKIGNESFKISYREREDGLFKITNCQRLRTLEIGNGCFIDFREFEISDVKSLQTISFGENHCCQYVRNAVFKGSHSLNDCDLGH